MVMIVVAGAIGYLYIFPTIGKIRDNQDTAVVFSREVAQVSGVNSQLQQKLTAINNIPIENKQRLMTYMPDSLDDVTFMRTMESILFSAGIEPATLQFGSGSNNEEKGQSSTADSSEETIVTSTEKTIQSTVSVSFETDESSLYNFFDAVEQSSVPFVLKETTLTQSESGQVSAELVYAVHALATTTTAISSTNPMMDEEFGMMEDPAF
jgi:hypothetical protein